MGNILKSASEVANEGEQRKWIGEPASERADRRRSNNNGNMAIYNAAPPSALQDDLSRGYRVSLDGGGGKAATKRVIYGEQRRSGANVHTMKSCEGSGCVNADSEGRYVMICIIILFKLTQPILVLFFRVCAARVEY